VVYNFNHCPWFVLFLLRYFWWNLRVGKKKVYEMISILRTEENTQKEHREVAEAIKLIFIKESPNVSEA